MKLIDANKFEGTISAPSSKSYLQRAIAIASFLEGQSKIHGYYPSDDANVALEIANAVGCKTDLEGSELTLSKDQFLLGKIEVNVGEAGLSTRMFAPILAAFNLNIEMVGEGSILTRPQDLIIEALTQMGVEVTSNSGLLPISFQGGVSETNLNIDGSMSSQLLTGLLISLSISGKGGVVEVDNLKSKPYVDMTIEILNHYGFKVSNSDYKIFTIDADQRGVGSDYSVEGDWSGASFHAVAGAIGGEVTLKNLNPRSKQSDTIVLKAIKLAGAKIEKNEDFIHIQKDYLHAFELDLTEAPDLFPPVCVLALACHGVTKLKGVSRLKHKESDRGIVLQKEFKKLGGRIELNGDEMWIHGNGHLSEGSIDSNNDHRIAMAGAIAVLIADGPVEIENEWAINKSYPTFYNDFMGGIC
jgi:3-phosphoshikimate 1-carboxyvinyltransferase